jgi:phosphoglycolate phosphatase
MTQKPVLIFDLDGTLIDSAPSILSTFARVLEEAGISAKVPLQNSLIGPPLPETLAILTGLSDPQRIQALIELFKQHYDGGTYRETRVYPGIANMLDALHGLGYQLHIATNKRYAPTRLIIDHLGWGQLFQSINALDRYAPRLPDKTALLRTLLAEQGLQPGQALYIGDKTEDGIAAEHNKLAFLAVAWGYGDFGASKHWHVLDAPASLLGRLKHEQIAH